MPQSSAFVLPPLYNNPEPIVDWAESNITVAYSDRSGLLRLDPYQKAILEAYDDPDVRDITLMWSSQLGKTLVDAIIVGHTIDQNPSTIFIVHGTDQGLKTFHREKLDPIILSNHSIASKLIYNNRGTIDKYGFGFEGGYCTMTTARSKEATGGKSSKIVIADESRVYDKPFETVDGIKQRKSSYAEDYKFIHSSTPGYKGFSPVEKDYLAGSQTWLYIKCPQCDRYFIIWKDCIKDGFVYCKGCDLVMTDRQRMQAIAMGKYVDHNPNDTHKSFWINQFYSYNITPQVTLETTETYTDYSFSTLILAWPFEEVVVPPINPDTIQRLKLDFDPFYMTVGVDVQENYLDYRVLLFDANLKRKHIYRRGYIDRTPDNVGHWITLRNEMRKLGPHKITVDGSYEFELVQTGLLKAFNTEYMVEYPIVEIVKGYSGDSFDKPIRGQNRAGYFHGSTDEVKVMINKDLKDRLLTLSPSLPKTEEKQLTSEKMVRMQVGMNEKRRWVVDPPGSRNEALDCTGYAYMGALDVHRLFISKGVRRKMR